MRLQQTQTLRQELRMNPRLYQAMDLLYMPLLDLQQHLKQELLVNPFLELIEPDDDLEVEEPAAEEPAEERDETDWEDILLDGFQTGTPARDLSVGGDEERYERVSVQQTDLADHLRDQLQMLHLTDRQRLLAEEFIGNIAEDGYLHASLEEIVAGANQLLAELRNGTPVRFGGVADTGVAGEAAAEGDAGHGERGDDPAAVPAGLGEFTLSEADELLRIIQQLDPPGIAARDLRECLLLQMDELGEQETLTYQLVRDHFEDLKAHRWGDIAKRLAIDPKAVQDAADSLARLDPKPGLRFLPSDDEYITPDLIVEKIEGQYRVFLNDSGTPRLRISQTYKDLAGDKKKFSGETKEFISEKLNSAQWLVQAIEQRRQTMLKVMNFIVDRQREFFEKGIEYLRPLTLREVADVIDMHESTVSRVTNQKYVQTPRGVFPLKFFFSSSLNTTSGEDASARAVRAQIEKLVGDEEPAKPLTDSAIVDELKRRGIQIARRTVAKYRDQLGILPARMRKRL